MSNAASNTAISTKKNCAEGDPLRLNVCLPFMQDVDTTTKTLDEAPLPVDFLLLTVKDCEFLACYMRLINPFRCWYDNIGFVYFENAGASNKVKVALIRSNEGSSGAGGALITVKNAAPVLRPKAVISVGTCSSLNPEKAKLGDVVVSAKLKELSTGMRIYVSRRFLYVIKHSADGFKAPLKNPQAHEPSVHWDGEFLSGPELVSAESRCKELAESHPQAIAFEREGEGVFTAAFDDQIEWLIVKGIADYADGAESTAESWNPFASVMASSVVVHILSDPGVFSTWPHHKDASYPTYIINSIRQLSKTCGERLFPVPWSEDFSFHLNDIFTRLTIVGKEKTQGNLTYEITNMTAIFKPRKDCQKPRTVLIEGDPGMGKTTYCQKLAYDWATKQDKCDESFPETDVLFLLRCRDIKSSSIKEAIDDQILPYDVSKEAKEVFFQFISENQLKGLLILDGVDEMDASKLEMIEKLLKSQEFANCHIVLTSRHEAGKKVRGYCDTLWDIVGFTKRDAASFILDYFMNIGKVSLAYKLLGKLWPSEFEYASHWISRDLSELTKNPLNTALLCILFEDFNGILPENRTQLYFEIVLFVLRRYERKNGLSSNSEDLTSVYEQELIHLGRMAFKALRKGELDFEENESGNAIFSLLIKFGFLTIQAGGSRRKPCFRCGFFHKSFQEFFSGLFLAFEINDEDIHYLVTDQRYLHDLKEVFLFMTGIAASQCEEIAVCFVSRVALLVNLFSHESGSKVTSYLQFALYYISQCPNYQENLKSRLADTFIGRNLNIKNLVVENPDFELLCEVVRANSTLTNLDLSYNSICDPSAESLSQALTVNSSLTNLVLGGNCIGHMGATSLSQALTVEYSLTNLDLSWNSIGDTGAASLSQALKVNYSLINLDLGGNRIGDTGAASLSQALRVNSSLTNLDLGGNRIGDTGAVSLSQALTVKSSLTNLVLSWCSIGDTGAASLIQALRVNSSLTNLDLGGNSIGDTGAAFLSRALTVISSMTNLDLGGNRIGDTGAASHSQALTVNSSLTNLDLGGNRIGDAGAVSLSQVLTVKSFLKTKQNKTKVKSSLNNLDLGGNRIGDTGAASLSQALTVKSFLKTKQNKTKVKSSLTNLDLGGNRIGDTGATSPSQALTVKSFLKTKQNKTKVKSSLNNLVLSWCSIGDTGAASLIQVLTVNSSLTNLDLGGNRIGHTGAASLSQALTVNSSLTNLDLGGNSIGDPGAESLSKALTVNSSLTNLDLSGNRIGDTGAASLFQALRENSSLTNLELSVNLIGDTVTASLFQALKVNSSLTTLYLSGNRIGDTFAESLSQALAINSSLTMIDLIANNINSSGGDYLSDVSKVNKTVKILI